ncbi:hypothetical protein [Sandaracinobacteroides saxicola]|uniref:ETS domain-containing protein n=1 Tax=Sandaracinobacteroides saxicola TaxID=2759707 RepID=A0A7G5IJ43_9SPHN|nr:hypothetical protein [Sandaracinobacteroides saxicola]QMW23385.1 hypothetical protein H3309_02460 [Sandaracinobacteroides saxicola]
MVEHMAMADAALRLVTARAVASGLVVQGADGGLRLSGAGLRARLWGSRQADADAALGWLRGALR